MVTARAVAFLLAVVLTGCTSMERLDRSDDRGLEFACSRFNPAMQGTLVEAVVAGGGPGRVELRGWMCGPHAYDYVRIVMLRYGEDDAAIVPAVFEGGSLVAFGWHLLEHDPQRYGADALPSRGSPWRLPEGWVASRYGTGAATAP